MLENNLASNSELEEIQEMIRARGLNLKSPVSINLQGVTYFGNCRIEIF